jgi:hypothetical protein
MNRCGKTNAKKGPDKDYNSFKELLQSGWVLLELRILKVYTHTSVCYAGGLYSLTKGWGTD